MRNFAISLFRKMNATQILENSLHTLFQNDLKALQQVLDWHFDYNFQYTTEAIYVCEELKAHPLLWIEKKVQLLTNIEFLLASAVRRAGKAALPSDWQPEQDLESLWLQPTEGYLPKLWRNSDSRYVKLIQTYTFDVHFLLRSPPVPFDTGFFEAPQADTV